MVYNMSCILKQYLTPEKIAELPTRKIKITIGGDSGGDKENKTFKLGFYFNELIKSRSTTQFFILCVKRGDDSYRNIYEILKFINQDLINLKGNGLEINGIKVDFEL